MSEPEPWDVKYKSYQKGFIQDRHIALTSELDLLIHYFVSDQQMKKYLLKRSFRRKNDELYKRKIISKDLYNDLDRINKARNFFVKSMGNPDEKRIRQLLNQIKCLWWDDSKRDKYGLYRLLIICFSQVHITVNNCPSYKKYLKAVLGINLEKS